MTTKVEAFVCDFCPRKKRFANRGTANRHENQCFHNPTRRACASCKHLTLEKGDIDEPGGAYCAFDLIPIPGTAEEPERPFTFDCEKWETKETHG